MPLLTMNRETADKLVDLLSTDDDFRVFFVQDTVAALHKAGYQPVPGDDIEKFARECCAGIKLADKERIAASRQRMQELLIQGVNQTMPTIGEDGFCGDRTLK